MDNNHTDNLYQWKEIDKNSSENTINPIQNETFKNETFKNGTFENEAFKDKVINDEAFKNEIYDQKLQGKTSDDLLAQKNETKNKLIDKLNTRVQSNMNKKMPFLVYQNLLKSGNYTYKDGSYRKNAKRTTHSPLMQNIISAMEKLDKLLDQPIDAATFDDMEKDIEDSMLKVCQTCETYIEKRNPWTAEGKARKQMVKDFFNDVSYETQHFSEMMKKIKTNKSLINNYPTWNAFFADLRTENFTHNKDGVTIERGGSGTSDVYIIKKDGVRTFFKEKESLPNAPGVDSFIAKEIANIASNKTLPEKTRKVYTEILTRVKDTINKNPDTKNLLFNMHHKNKESFYSTVIKATKITGTPSEEAKMYLQNTFWNMKKNYTLGNIAINTARIEGGSEITKRNVATSRMAKILGISDIIAESSMVKINVDGKEMTGIRMEDAKGEDIKEANSKYKNSLKYSNNALKQLFTLQVFDLICAQTDRHYMNYIVRRENPEKPHEITSIVGIDNDMSFGEVSYNDILAQGKTGYAAIKNMEIDNFVTLHGIDATFANKILTLTPEIIDFKMCDLLNKKERAKLIDRITHVQDIIRKMKEHYSENVIENEKGWDSVREDLFSTSTDDIHDSTYLFKNLL